MKTDSPSRSSESNTAVAQSAGRELITSALQRNPIVAIASLVLGPILGLFRRRGSPPPTEVQKVKLESYSSRPAGPEGYPKDYRRITEGSRRHGPRPHGLPWVRLPSGRIANPAKGGCHHG